MLAGHHPVEAVLGRERGLGADLGDDLGCAEVEVRVAAQRDRPGPERPTVSKAADRNDRGCR